MDGIEKENRELRMSPGSSSGVLCPQRGDSDQELRGMAERTAGTATGGV